MIEIIPAIIAKNEKELEEKIKKVKNAADWIQLDIMDNKFVPNLTINNPIKISKILKKFPKINFEVHLMIKNPEKRINNWLKSNAKRLIIHFESTNKKKLIDLIKKIKKSKIEIGLAVNPETSTSDIKHLKNIINKIDLILFLSVHPGFSGQKFIKSTIKKIKLFHKLYSNVKIGVDGGLNDKNIKNVIKVGSQNLIFGSFVFNSKSPSKAIKNIKQIIYG